MSTDHPPALILIDIQRGFEDLAYFGGRRNNPKAEQQAAQLLAIWRAKGYPLFHVKHNSVHPDSPLVKGKPGNEIQADVYPMDGEPLIEKQAHSAFIGTDLKERLDRLGIRKLVLVGLTTNHCVSTSARMASDLGYDTYLLSDAVAAFDAQGPDGRVYAAEQLHEATLASLHREFLTVMTTEEAIQKWA